MTHHTRAVLTVLLALGLATTAFAQAEPAQPRPEDRIAALEAELAMVRAERDGLRVRLAEAIEMLRNLGYAAPAPMLAEPSDPMASPIAVMQTLRRRARLELAPIARDSAEDRAAYRKAAQDWAQKMNEALSGEKDWLVRVLRVSLPMSSSTAARATAEVQLFDASTGAPLSLPLEVSVPGRVARRMANGGTEQGWTAHVKLETKARHNPERQERGPFDHPPFLAPEVEATVGVEWMRFETTDVPEGFFPPAPGDDPLAVPERAQDAAPAPSPEPARQPR